MCLGVGDKSHAGGEGVVRRRRRMYVKCVIPRGGRCVGLPWQGRRRCGRRCGIVNMTACGVIGIR